MIGHYGGDLAGPVFRRVAEGTLRYLGVTPSEGSKKIEVSRSDDPADKVIAAIPRERGAGADADQRRRRAEQRPSERRDPGAGRRQHGRARRGPRDAGRGARAPDRRERSRRAAVARGGHGRAEGQRGAAILRAVFMNAIDEVAPDHPTRLGDLVRELGASLDGDATIEVRGLHHDSRRVRPGDLFVVRKGASADGAKYVQDARKAGATAVLAAPGSLDARAAGLPVVAVGDVLEGLARASSVIYGHPSFALEVVGITGTNGKTTTTHLVRVGDRRGQGRTELRDHRHRRARLRRVLRHGRAHDPRGRRSRSA